MKYEEQLDFTAYIYEDLIGFYKRYLIDDTSETCITETTILFSDALQNLRNISSAALVTDLYLQELAREYGNMKTCPTGLAELSEVARQFADAERDAIYKDACHYYVEHQFPINLQLAVESAL